MDRLEEHLAKYNDTELAYLIKFQLEKYIPETQEKIRDYIFRSRHLDQTKMDELISKNEHLPFNGDKHHCPRCKTDKLTATSRFCPVCNFELYVTGYDFGDDITDTLFNLLDDLL